MSGGVGRCGQPRQGGKAGGLTSSFAGKLWGTVQNTHFSVIAPDESPPNLHRYGLRTDCGHDSLVLPACPAGRERGSHGQSRWSWGREVWCLQRAALCGYECPQNRAGCKRGHCRQGTVLGRKDRVFVLQEPWSNGVSLGTENQK